MVEEQQDIQNLQNTSVKGNVIRLEEKERKSFEKKIQDLTRSNKQMMAEIETWRRKCVVIQEKYNSIRTFTGKDKFIGINRN